VRRDLAEVIRLLRRMDFGAGRPASHPEEPSAGGGP
jgi:hypothetical protein